MCSLFAGSLFNPFLKGFPNRRTNNSFSSSWNYGSISMLATKRSFYFTWHSFFIIHVLDLIFDKNPIFTDVCEELKKVSFVKNFIFVVLSIDTHYVWAIDPWILGQDFQVIRKLYAFLSEKHFTNYCLFLWEFFFSAFLAINWGIFWLHSHYFLWVSLIKVKLNYN